MSKADNVKVADGRYTEIVKDLFACCRHMQNKLHGINAQVCSYRHLRDSPRMTEMCIDNIEGFTRYIYDGDKFGFFPRVDETLKKARALLLEDGAFGDFNDLTGFGKKGS